MNALVSGAVFAAWTAVQSLLGLFFLRAYAARRREGEYLLFGLTSLALALCDLGLTLAALAADLARWGWGIRLALGGGAAAAALNFHFVLRFVGAAQERRWAWLGYVTGAGFVLASVAGSWWEPAQVVVVPALELGLAIERVRVVPTFLTWVFHAVVVASSGAAVALLVRAYRRGRTEASRTLAGIVVAALLVGHDLLVFSGVFEPPFLTPYGYVVYAFAVASTLLLRYGRSAADLEQQAERLRQALAELSAAHDDQERMAAELGRREHLASVGELAASIAHEVRNPLAVIFNAVANLRRPKVRAADRDTLLAIIEEETTRLDLLVRELLRFARPVRLVEGLFCVDDLLQGVPARPGLQLAAEVQVAGDAIEAELCGDVDVLKGALVALLNNAYQALPPGVLPRLEVEATRVEGGVELRLAVVDTGAGMSPEVARRALEPFFSTQPSGTGLGLPIVRRIVEAHQGSLSVDSAEHVGTRVTMRIPLRLAASVPELAALTRASRVA